MPNDSLDGRKREICANSTPILPRNAVPSEASFEIACVRGRYRLVRPVLQSTYNNLLPLGFEAEIVNAMLQYCRTSCPETNSNQFPEKGKY